MPQQNVSAQLLDQLVTYARTHGVPAYHDLTLERSGFSRDRIKEVFGSVSVMRQTVRDALRRHQGKRPDMSDAESSDEVELDYERQQELLKALALALDSHGDVQQAQALRLTGYAARTYKAAFATDDWGAIKSKALRMMKEKPVAKHKPTKNNDPFFADESDEDSWDGKTTYEVPNDDLVQEYSYKPLVPKAKKTGVNKKTVKRVVIIPDTHVPVHDKKALGAVISFIEDQKPDKIVILGDWMDAESVSRWDAKSARRILLMEEVNAAVQGLEQIREAAGKEAEIIFLEGNHEERVRNYIVANSPALYGITDIKKLLQMERLKIEFVPTMALPYKLGKARFIHGAYTNKYHAAKHLDAYRHELIFYGHVHDVQRYAAPAPDERGRPFTATSFGCLISPRQLYMKGRPTNWEHAFGLLYIYPNGEMTDIVIPIHGGKFTFEGSTYEGQA